MKLFDQFLSMLSSKVDLDSRYEMLRETVSGTMSSFFKVRDRQTGQIVGLKILDPEKSSIVESRFKGCNKPSEAEIGLALQHSNIVKTLAHGTSYDNKQFIVLEFLEGVGLNSLLISRSVQLDGRRLDIIRKMAEAVGAVHKAGFIHRDICPRNFMVSPQFDRVTLIDFGLTLPAKPEFMQPGNRTGTPNYMSPEIVRRKKTDLRVDVFAFGVTAYEVMTFELPWTRGIDGRAALEHDLAPPVEITERRPKINKTLAKAIMWCLVNNPDDRCPSMERFLSAIASVKSEDAD
ncbi:MAG TPA: serine/threonine-protein kinase [Pirellulales bacterium]|nr:serine/threonine-protein kinase [Pirellulales bacterium]